MKLSRIATLSSSLLLAVGLALTGAGAAQGAQQATPTGYVALGDSYSSGVGSGSYDSSSGDCLRSPRAYPALWAAAHSPSSFHFAACSGARTGDVLSGQLSSLGTSTGLVSLTIGGNDAGFADTMTTCVLQSQSSCLSRLATANSYIDSTLPGLLDQVYSAITARASAAHVVVLGYPRFYELNGSCIAGLSETERSAINAASDHLNSVTAKRALDHGFAFGSVTSAFAGHEICSGNSWLHSVNLFNLTESYHPTAAGQSGGYLPVLNTED
ncbi:SGNH/GDSL hydrolase family protein [Streptomyces sp. NPDC051320]|uniref:SGNH/GDSL hydrolase family protein n=1 Tax=Streptomyces sp. NPDC051320 TaxID=3154644 RepID=UPI003438CD30